MRRERLFTDKERKTAMWALLVSVALAASGLLADRAFGCPPLGLYDAPAAAVSLPGIVEARPL